MSETQEKNQHAGVAPCHITLTLQFLEAVLYKSLDILIEMLLLRIERAVDIVHDTFRKIKKRLSGTLPYLRRFIGISADGELSGREDSGFLIDRGGNLPYADVFIRLEHTKSTAITCLERRNLHAHATP